MGRDYALEAPQADRPQGASAPTRSATASSSRATPPRRWARSMAAPRWRRGIRSRRRPRWPRRSSAIAGATASIRRPARHRYAIVQAEDELASIGIVIGAAWNGARAFTCTSGPGHLADAGVPRPRLFRRDSGGDLRRAARRARRPACRRAPSRPTSSRAAYASHGDTKHRLLFPEDPRECFEMGALAFDLADRLQTPIFVMLDLDIGMNEWLSKPFAWDDTPAARPRQGDDRGRARGRQGFRPLSRRRRRRHPLPHLSRARIRPSGAYLHPRHLARPLRRATARKARSMSTTCSGCCASSRPRRSWCRRRCARDAKQKTKTRRDLFRLDHGRRCTRRSRRSKAQGIHLDALRVRGFPFADEVLDFIAAHEQVFVVEQNRDAQLRTLLVNEGGIDPAKLVPGAALRRHADHRALHHRRDRRAAARSKVPPLRGGRR